MLPAIAVNKGCCSHPAMPAPAPAEPRGNSGWRQVGCPLPSPHPLQPPSPVYPEGTQDGKAVDIGIDTKANIKGMISLSSDSIIFLYIEKG